MNFTIPWKTAQTQQGTLLSRDAGKGWGSNTDRTVETFWLLHSCTHLWAITATWRSFAQNKNRFSTHTSNHKNLILPIRDDRYKQVVFALPRIRTPQRCDWLIPWTAQSHSYSATPFLQSMFLPFVSNLRRSLPNGLQFPSGFTTCLLCILHVFRHATWLVNPTHFHFIALVVHSYYKNIKV